MGYFSNGSEGMAYQERYCERCVHDAQNDCPIWGAHLLYSGRDANDPTSILHLLIPLSDDGLGNKECLLFRLDPERARGAEADQKYLDWSAGR